MTQTAEQTTTHETTTDTRRQNPIMKFFKYDHLPEKLQETSKQFATLAEWIDTTLPANAETSTALRRVLEAKDCAVRAAL